MVKTSDCGSDIRGFESHYPPHLQNRTVRFFFYVGSRDENPKCVSIFLGFGGFADGRHEVSPDSEGIEQT